MMHFYYAKTDENGVLCVDQLDGGDTEFTPEEVAKIATSYPDTIYTRIERFFCVTFACGECRGCRVSRNPYP